MGVQLKATAMVQPGELSLLEIIQRKFLFSHFYHNKLADFSRWNDWYTVEIVRESIQVPCNQGQDTNGQVSDYTACRVYGSANQ
jgi:hypothetical protein